MDGRLVPPGWNGPDLAVGTWLLEPSTALHAALGRAGLDFVVVDCQHSLLDDTSAAAFLARMPSGPPTVVRASSLDAAAIGLLADSGADGVIAPGVETAEDAARLVAALRYPPHGRRSFGPQRADLGTNPDVLAARVAAIPLVESAAAVAVVEEICGVDGVDAVFVGPMDLAISLGVPPARAVLDERVLDAVRRVTTAASAAGLPVGIHAADVTTAALWRRLGADAVTVASAPRLLEQAAGTLAGDIDAAPDAPARSGAAGY